MRFEAVRRKIDVADSVITNEKIDNLRQFASQRRLPTAEPQISEGRRAFRKLHDFRPGQIAFLVQLVPIKARFARGITMRRYEKDDRVQLSLAAEPPNTRVSLREISL